MKNLVVKTAAVTLAAIIVLIVAVYLIFALAFPKTLAEGFKAIGSYSLSVKYYEKQYKKSGGTADLAVLCVVLNEKSDSARAVKYLGALTESEDFAVYCAGEDEHGGFKMTAYEFYYGKYTVAEFYENGIDAAITAAKKAVAAGYTENNAFYVLLVDADTLGAQGGQAVSSAVTEIKSGLTEQEQIDYAQRDIDLANSLV